MKNITCCFTGHRVIASTELDNVLLRLRLLIPELVKNRGITEFVAGGAIGFDTLAAETVLEAKKDYPSVKLHLVLPCPEQAKMWKAEQKSQYARILDEADSVEYVCNSYTRWCMAQRNRKMIELSSLVIAYYNKEGKGGTAMTVGFAQKNGLEVINLF